MNVVSGIEITKATSYECTSHKHYNIVLFYEVIFLYLEITGHGNEWKYLKFISVIVIQYFVHVDKFLMLSHSILIGFNYIYS